MFIYFTVSNIAYIYIYIYIIVYIKPHCLLMFEVFSTLPMLIWTPPLRFVILNIFLLTCTKIGDLNTNISVNVSQNFGN